MEYTDQQRAAFKDVYAKRIRKQLIMIVLLFAVMAPFPFIVDDAPFFGLSGAGLGPVSFVAIVVGWVSFIGGNWRCPACNSSVGRACIPGRCG